MSGNKRRLGLAVLSFPLVFSVLWFVLFWAGIFLGIVPLMCGGPLAKLLPAYFWGGMVLSIALSAIASMRIHCWLTSRAAARASLIESAAPRTRKSRSRTLHEAGKDGRLSRTHSRAM